MACLMDSEDRDLQDLKNKTEPSTWIQSRCSIDLLLLTPYSWTIKSNHKSEDQILGNQIFQLPGFSTFKMIVVDKIKAESTENRIWTLGYTMRRRLNVFLN